MLLWEKHQLNKFFESYKETKATRITALGILQIPKNKKGVRFVKTGNFIKLKYQI